MSSRQQFDITTEVAAFTGSTGAEVNLPLSRVPEGREASLVDFVDRRGDLASANLPLRYHALALDGWEVASNFSRYKPAELKVGLIEDGLGRIKQGDPFGILIEGAVSAYYGVQRRNADGTGSGGADSYLTSGVLIAQEKLLLGLAPNARGATYLSAVPLRDFVESPRDGGDRSAYGYVNTGIEYTGSRATGSQLSVENHPGNRQSGTPGELRVHINSGEMDRGRNEIGLSYINLVMPAGVEVSIVRRRETSHGLEVLVKEHGFTPVEAEQAQEHLGRLVAAKLDSKNVKFVVQKDLGLVVGMDIAGTAMYVGFSEPQYPYALSTRELGAIFGDSIKTAGATSRTNLSVILGSRIEGISLGRQENYVECRHFYFSGLTPHDFSANVLSSMFNAVDGVKARQAEMKLTETLIQKRKEAFEASLVDAEQQVRTLASQVPQDLDRAASLIDAALSPLHLQGQQGAFADYLRAQSTPAIAASMANLTDADIERGQRRVLTEEALNLAQHARENTRVFEAELPSAGLIATFSVFRTAGTRANVLYEVGFRRLDGEALGREDLNQLGAIAKGDIKYDGLLPFLGKPAPSSCRSIFFEIGDIGALPRFLAGLRTKMSAADMVA